MEVSATLRHARISPQKCRLVADTVRGQPVNTALNVLKFMPKKGAELVYKVLWSAIANAQENKGLDVDDLKVARIGPPVSHGRSLKTQAETQAETQVR